MHDVELITDGSCLGNPGPGGWAALVRVAEDEQMLSGSEANTTNNRMELMAIIKGLEAIPISARVKITSDSKYVIDAFRQDWIGNWQKNGWRTAARKPVANQDLWQDLIAAIEPHEVQWFWVKGHAGHADNERVDKAALAAAEGLAASISP